MSDRLRIGSLFSGVGGLDMAVESFFAGETVWHCEFDPEPSKVLAARWPGVPNFGDVTAVDWSKVEPVDILCGGFPCQDLSLAGRRSGMRPGTRSGLWADFVKAIDALRPKVVVIENVRGLLSGCAESASDSTLGPCPRCLDPDGGASHSPNVRALGRVLGDLSTLGFDAEWHGLLASDIGAPHGRFRVFVLAYARGVRLDERWRAVTGEAQGGRASAIVGGRADSPLRDRHLLRTPVADELGGGPLHPDVAKERGQTLRLSGQVLALGGHLHAPLLPTPVAQPSGNTPEEHLRKKPGRKVVTDLAILVENDLLKTGGRLLPTPTASEGVKGGPGQRHGGGDATLSGIAPKLLPTPQVADMQGGHASRSGSRSDEMLLPGVAVAAQEGRLLPTPRASRGASGTETMYALGAERDDTGDRQWNVVLPRKLLGTPTTSVDGSGADMEKREKRVQAAREKHGRPFGESLGVQVATKISASESGIEWGEYELAVRLWESITRPAPAPTLPDGKNGNHRLAAVFPEWMMGYPLGHVTDILKRNPAIKACGNGVVPQQAFAALGVMWARAFEWMEVAA